MVEYLTGLLANWSNRHRKILVARSRQVKPFFLHEQANDNQFPSLIGDNARCFSLKNGQFQQSQLAIPKPGLNA